MEIRGVNVEEEGLLQDSQFMRDIFELQEEIEEATPVEAEKISRRIETVLVELKTNLHKFF